MKVCGIVCEYNPFHKGHAYQIQAARKAGATHIAAVMSGSFLQRGDIACFSKWDRAKAALVCGCDLVIELPAAYALSSAERFASGAVSLLDAMGCVDMLHFGSESGELGKLLAAAQICYRLDGSPELQKQMKSGENHAAVRQTMVSRQSGPEIGELLASPNNTLAIEYLKALIRLRSPIVPFTVRRQGAAHDGADLADGYASASRLREFLSQGEESAFLEGVPQQAGAVYQQTIARNSWQIDRPAFEDALLFALRRLSKEELARLPDVTEGLENRLHSAAQHAKTLNEFYALSKTRRYPLSRLRRIACSALLKITAGDGRLPPSYLRILGLTPKGAEILRRMKVTARVAFDTSFARLEQSAGGRLLELDRISTDCYHFFLKDRKPGGLDYVTPVIWVDGKEKSGYN